MGGDGPRTFDGRPVPICTHPDVDADDVLSPWRGAGSSGAPTCVPLRRTVLDTFDGRLHPAGLRLELYEASERELLVTGDGPAARALIAARPRFDSDLPGGPLRARLAHHHRRGGRRRRSPGPLGFADGRARPDRRGTRCPPPRPSQPGRRVRRQLGRHRQRHRSRVPPRPSGGRPPYPIRARPGEASPSVRHARSVREDFGWLGAATGPARDLDVYVIEWASYVAPLGAEVAASLVPSSSTSPTGAGRSMPHWRRGCDPPATATSWSLGGVGWKRRSRRTTSAMPPLPSGRSPPAVSRRPTTASSPGVVPSAPIPPPRSCTRTPRSSATCSSASAPSCPRRSARPSSSG